MSFSADKVNVLKGAFSQRRFSSSKEPTESGEFGVSLVSFQVHGWVLGTGRSAEHLAAQQQQGWIVRQVTGPLVAHAIQCLQVCV